MSTPPRQPSPTPVFAPRPLRSQTRAQPPLLLQDPPRTPPLERKPTPTISGTPGDGAPPRIYSPGPTSSEALDDFFKLIRRNSLRSPGVSMQPPQSPVRRELARNPIAFNTAFGGAEGVALGSIAGMTGMGGITVVPPVERGPTDAKKEGSGES